MQLFQKSKGLKMPDTFVAAAEAFGKPVMAPLRET